ncbi:MAG: amino acid permease [Candidatus Omnitrophica bacterium]|nr:amino acid permease [Candidatus Omnitrophota bacterium]
MSNRRFSMFEGVFTPCLLSVLGVIMYLRLGWVVGNVGLAGALLIIVFSHLITLSTALSMSSVVTNIRIGTGGAYSIISKSLGIEAGGAIGLPLYISQAVSVAFYITGFGESWLFVFPGHSILLVSLGAWFVLLLVSYFSTKLAFRIQYAILALIVLSLVSIFGTKEIASDNFSFFGGFSSLNFWSVFAIFFPAVTGILAGASMSGELKDPRISIPKGTLWAIAVGFVVYISLAYFFASRVPLDVLINNQKIAIDLGRWKILVIAGTMGATLSSALVMFVGAPRVLLALGKHAVFPLSSKFTHLNEKGEPTTAILVTALISLVTILCGSLNQIASLLTMFFLITYGIINFTVFVEQTIGIASFRPTLRIPKIIPLLGSLGCLGIMFLINVKFSFVAVSIILVLYIALLKKGTKFYSPDIRSGMLVFLAEQFVKSASRLPYYPKIWKPNVFIPVQDIDNLDPVVFFVRNIVSPSGRVTIVNVIGQEQYLSLKRKFGSVSKNEEERKSVVDMQRLAIFEKVEKLKENNIFVEVSVAISDSFSGGASAIMQAFKGIVFPPNILFYLLLQEDKVSDHSIVDRACAEGLGVMVLKLNSRVGFGREKNINLWIRQGSPNMDLAVLISLQLRKNWDGMIRLVQVVATDTARLDAEQYLEKLCQLMRLAPQVEIVVLIGEFMFVLKQAPVADINIFGMQEKPDCQNMHRVANVVQTSILFLRDSKHESALA